MSSLCPSLTCSLAAERGHKILGTQTAGYKLNNTQFHTDVFSSENLADSAFFSCFQHFKTRIFFSCKHLFVVFHEYKRRKTLRRECHAFLFFYILPIFPLLCCEIAAHFHGCSFHDICRSLMSGGVCVHSCV